MRRRADALRTVRFRSKPEAPLSAARVQMQKSEPSCATDTGRVEVGDSSGQLDWMTVARVGRSLATFPSAPFAQSRGLDAEPAGRVGRRLLKRARDPAVRPAPAHHSWSIKGDRRLESEAPVHTSLSVSVRWAAESGVDRRQWQASVPQASQASPRARKVRLDRCPRIRPPVGMRASRGASRRSRRGLGRRPRSAGLWPGRSC